MSWLHARRALLLVSIVLVLCGIAACGLDGGDEDATGTTAGRAGTGAATTTTEVATTTTATPPGEPVPACTLLTETDAAEALGEDVVPGPVQEQDECEWMTSDELRTVEVRRLSDDVDDWRTAHRNDSFETIDLADEAYFGNVFDDVSFRVGDQLYEVDVELRGDGDAEQVVTELAELVLSRL